MKENLESSWYDISVSNFFNTVFFIVLGKYPYYRLFDILQLFTCSCQVYNEV